MIDELPYAPTRKRPLSLFNPLDYLVLLYWVFYFPQALRWYVERFGSAPADRKILEVLRQDRVQRNLVVQGLVLLGFFWILWLMVIAVRSELSSSWMALGVSPLLLVTAAYALALWAGVTFGVTFGVAFGVTVVLAAVLAALLAAGVAIGVADALLVGIGVLLVFSLAVIVGLGAAINTAGAVAPLVAGSVARSVMLGVSGGVSVGLTSGMAVGAICGVAFGLALGVTICLASFRPDAALLACLPAWLQRSKLFAVLIQRVSPLPIPGLEERLAERLHADWLAGLRMGEGLLRYSLQFIRVNAAIGKALAKTDGALIAHIAAWCDLGPYSWLALRYQSASLRACLKAEFWRRFVDIFFLPRRWCPTIDDALRFDTPARAACAGFWCLHEGEVEPAEQAFTFVKHLAHGTELHANAAALAFAARCDAFDKIGDWSSPPENPGAELLRPGVAAILQRLGEAARDARLVRDSRSIRERSSALNRAIGALRQMQEQMDACPQPEQVVVRKIVAQWLELVLGVASEIGTLSAREPVASPYIVGAPVPAHRLVGRESVYDQMRSAWVKTGQRDSLVIYGHRRMGKTSVLHNVLEFCDMGANTGLAYLNLQTVDWSEPLADLCRAIAFALAQAAPQASQSNAADFEHHPLHALRLFLAELNAGDSQRRCILVLDEYELLDEHLPADQASAFVTLLRGLTQQYPWLVVALVGLHSLRERSASFYQAIYAWRSIRVSFLDSGGVADLLQVEDDAFPLAYSPQALARIHQLTGGQPFLVQLIGDGLVQGFNRRLREQIQPPAPTFAAADVEALLDSQALFEQGNVYFRGIWEQAAAAPAGQQALLRIVAPHADGLAEEALASEFSNHYGSNGGKLTAALEALIDHDVLVGKSGRYRYTVELMRLWVTSEQNESESERD